MTLTVLDINAAAMQVVLVTFTWGVSNVARYARSTTNVVSNSQTFLAEPTLNFRFDNPLGGGTDDSPMTLTMNMKKAPFTTLCLPYVHAAVNVLVEFVSPGDDSSRFEVFSGRIGRIKVKPSGQQGLASAKIVGVKARLNATIGIPALSSCVHQFGDENLSRCGVTLADKRVTGTLDGINVANTLNYVTLSGLGGGDWTTERWNRGYMEYDGLRITIRQSLENGVGFHLKHQPPPYWLGKTITLTPGCGKTLANCQYWQNVLRFLAPGYAMPQRNPVFEE